MRHPAAVARGIGIVVARGNTRPIPRVGTSLLPGATAHLTGGVLGRHHHAPEPEGRGREDLDLPPSGGARSPRIGKRVLLVDNDPQASLTQGLWGPAAARELDPAETIAAVYAGDAVPEQIIHRTGIAGIDLVPGSGGRPRYNVPDPYAADRDAQACLRDVVDEVRGPTTSS